MMLVRTGPLVKVKVKARETRWWAVRVLKTAVLTSTL